MPIVKSRALELAVVDSKSHRLDDMQTTAGSGTGAGDVAAVLRDLRLHQYHVQQSQFSFRCAAKYSRNFAVRLLSYCMPNFLENQSENTDFYEYFIDYTDWSEQAPFFCEKCRIDFFQNSPPSRFSPKKTPFFRSSPKIANMRPRKKQPPEGLFIFIIYNNFISFNSDCYIIYTPAHIH